MRANIYKLLCCSEQETRKLIIATLKAKKIPFRIESEYIVTTLPGVHPLICVHTDTVLSLRKNSFIACLGADDRAGVWIALKMITDGTITAYNYAFFCGEEKGCIGSSIFNVTEELDAYSCFIGLDRASRSGKQNCALYGYDNDELTEIFTAKGYEEAYGSYTDCSNIAGVTDMACINLSIGYQHEHGKKEILDLTMMEDTLEVMQTVLIPSQLYPAKEERYTYNGYHGYNSALNGLSKALCCEICGEHTLLYEQPDGTILCSICETIDAKQFNMEF